MSWKQPAGWTLAGLLTTGTAAVLCATLVSLPGSVSAAPISRGTSPVTSATRTPSTPITSHDRVYTTDQSSNTVSVIDPSTNKTLGTIALGAQRLSNVLSPQYTGDVDVHGLIASKDGKRIAAVSVTSNTVDIIDTATNKVLSHTDVGRASHEGWFTNDGKQFWVAARGTDSITIVDAVHGGVITNLPVGAGPSKVVMSPDGRTAYINHISLPEITVVDVASHKILDHITGLADTFSSDEAISPDGLELWVPHKHTGKTTVVDLVHRKVQAILTTGPDTNHPNFATTTAGSFAYVTVGGLDQVNVYRRVPTGTPPLVTAIHDNGHAPHPIWPSGDGTHLYVGLEKSDAVDVIDTATNKVINTIPSGQEPNGLVYVPNASPKSDAPNLGTQGLNQQAQDIPTTLPDGTEGDTLDPVNGRHLEANIRPLGGLDMIELQARGLQPNMTYQASSVAADGTQSTVMTFMTDATGSNPMALAFSAFNGKGIALKIMGGTDRPVSSAVGMMGTTDPTPVTSADLFFCCCC
jgi:YVTN family beta-propeller protein